MAKTTAPFFSLGARGTLADAITYSTWKGIPYVRTRVIPANPNTVAQQGRRDPFSALAATWSRGPGALRLPFEAAAVGRPLTARNVFFQQNLRGITPGDTWADTLIMAVPNSGALPPDSMTATQTDPLEITVETVSPAVPAGWTLVGMTALATPDQDNDNGLPMLFTSGSAAGDTVVLTVPATGDYIVGSYFTWTDPAGVTRYSASLRRTVAVV